MFREGPYALTYVGLAVLTGFAYALLLPGLLLGSFELVALHFLTWTQAVFAVAMGLLIPMVVLLNVYLWRHPACVVSTTGPRGRSAASGALLGILPNALCCSPVLPTLVAVFAAGGSAVAITAPLQYFFATYEAPFYAVAALLMWVSFRTAAQRLDSERASDSVRFLTAMRPGDVRLRSSGHRVDSQVNSEAPHRHED
ncbi:MAG: hypothetical protein L3K14_06290 [Thermoplasmata archaeon]|nr:hypothetical protein [Thermoplasmata archaeon]